MSVRVIALCAFMVIYLPTITADGLTYKTTCNKKAKSTPDYLKTTSQFLEALNYVVETHQVTTEDGYILELHRMPGEKIHENPSNKVKKKVILLVHGFAGASDMWLPLGENSFPVVLSQNGYDVWLINSRGTTYSYKHLNCTNKDKEYWNYSFHEIGLYDLSSTIDYILPYTKKKSLYLAGHSKGCTNAFALLSERPEYNKKVRLIISFSPVVHLTYAPSIFMTTVRWIEYDKLLKLKEILDQIGIYKLPHQSKMRRTIRSKLCSGTGFNPCTILNTIFYGTASTSDTRLLNVFNAVYPNEDSIKSMFHHIQIANTGRFAQYDYGEEGNLAAYGQTLSPLYSLNEVTAPVLIYHANADHMADPTDVLRLYDELQNSVGIFAVNNSLFNHNDELWGKEAVRLLYNPTIQFISQGNY